MNDDLFGHARPATAARRYLLGTNQAHLVPAGSSMALCGANALGTGSWAAPASTALDRVFMAHLPICFTCERVKRRSL